MDSVTRDRLIAEHESSKEILKPFLRGRDVKRWRCEFAEQYLIKIESSDNVNHAWSGKSEKESERIFAKAFPAVHAHFESMRKHLLKRYDQGKYFWELRACSYWQEFDQPKIISTKVSLQPTFALDSGGYLLANTAYFIPAKHNSHYLSALLNSNVFQGYASRIFVEKQNGWYEVQPNGLEMFGIPTATPDQKSDIERLVDRVLAAKKDDPAADVTALEREIDERVYRLYGLTKETIRIVEGGEWNERG